MSLEEITLVLFAACNSVRVVAYIPQIFKAATDKNGASSISFMTWSLFLLAHLSTVVYTIINRSDWGLAACFAINAVAALPSWQSPFGSAATTPDGPCSMPARRPSARRCEA
jgi:uncharacterized protein with PQ loop repeat